MTENAIKAAFEMGTAAYHAGRSANGKKPAEFHALVDLYDLATMINCLRAYYGGFQSVQFDEPTLIAGGGEVCVTENHRAKWEDYA